MTASAQTATTGAAPWDKKPAATDYKPVFPTMASVIPKTVDYGHGHGMSSKVDN